MSRNMDLVRSILMFLGNCPAGVPVQDFDSVCPDKAVLAEHLEMMIGHGLLEGEVVGDHKQGFYPLIHRMTWKGQDFLEAIKKESVWQKVRAKLSSVGAGVTLEVVKDLATQYMREELGL